MFLWHGMILGRDRDTLDAWFDRYRTFVLKWARVARDGFERRAAVWRAQRDAGRLRHSEQEYRERFDLEIKTEGWIAGLQLAALPLQGSAASSPSAACWARGRPSSAAASAPILAERNTGLEELFATIVILIIFASAGFSPTSSSAKSWHPRVSR